MAKMKKYIVEVFACPTEIEVEATSKNEARELAKAKVSFSVWESKARRVD
mgnify:CR=1 FL=1